MGYLDTAKAARGDVGTPYLNTPVAESTTGYALNDKNAKSSELPMLETRFTRGHEALRRRVLGLGAERGYPALSLGQYRIRKRVGTVGLFAGEGWWKHQTNYFGDKLLAEAAKAMLADRGAEGAGGAKSPQPAGPQNNRHAFSHAYKLTRNVHHEQTT
jgi:hypothetical protein